MVGTITADRTLTRPPCARPQTTPPCADWPAGVVLLAIPFGVVIGLALGLLGGGGAVLAVPILVYVLGQDVQEATTASLVVVAVGALAGGAGKASQQQVCWRHAGAFAAAALVGTALGTAGNRAVSGQLLIATFAVVMLAAAWFTWRQASGDPLSGGSHGGCPPLRVARDGLAGLGVGALTGFFGVGGGFMIVPALALILAFPFRSAVGTSLVIVTAISLMALTAHLLFGASFEPGVTFALAAAAGVGALAGSRLGGRVSDQRLGKGFSGLLVAVAGYLLISSLFLGGAPGA